MRGLGRDPQGVSGNRTPKILIKGTRFYFQERGAFIEHYGAGEERSSGKWVITSGDRGTWSSGCNSGMDVSTATLTMVEPSFQATRIVLISYYALRAKIIHLKGTTRHDSIKALAMATGMQMDSQI